ncbi:glycogen synthase [Patescibacteria group bacterium]|nr:glycogen synthase [Patescibacteria group bacterium]
MKILFAASEVDPIIKVGGIADVIGSLGKEIKNAGHDIRIVIPFYQVLKKKKLDSLKNLGSFKVKIDRKIETVNIFQTELDRKIPVYLLEHEKYLSQGKVYLDSNDFSSVARFLFFSVSVLKIFKTINWQPDIIHAHDWQTGLIPVLAKLKKSDFKILFTIHNLLIQGSWNHKQVLKFLGLKGDETPTLKEKISGAYGDDFNLMQQAILNADIITTVSPSYAQEIKTKDYYARGLQAIIQKRKNDIHGVLNGIDVNIFNPETDSFIKKHYSIKSLENKTVNKLALQKQIGLKQEATIPLLGLISRLDVQKGIDLISQTIDQIVSLGCQVVFLGTGVKKYEEMLIQASQKYPDQVVTYLKFDSKLAQQIYAGVDIFLMPSRFEPCGLSQLIAMRYGTIPIVRATGGLKDTVENFKIEQGLFGFNKKIKGTGFTFDQFNQQEFIKTIKKSLEIYADKKFWRQLQINAMGQDFSWQQSAKEYLKLYKQLL